MNNQEKNSGETLGKMMRPIEDLLLSKQFAETMQKVVQDNHLRVDEASGLENELGLVLVGLEQPQDFVVNLKAHVGLPHHKAIALAEDLNREVFIPIQETLKTAWGNRVSTQDSGRVRFGKEDGPEENLNRDELMRELERPEGKDGELLGLERSMPKDVERHAQKKTATKDDMEKSGLFSDTSKIAEEKMTKQTSSSAGYKDIDPYREPIE